MCFNDIIIMKIYIVDKSKKIFKSFEILEMSKKIRFDELYDFSDSYKTYDKKKYNDTEIISITINGNKLNEILFDHSDDLVFYIEMKDELIVYYHSQINKWSIKSNKYDLPGSHSFDFNSNCIYSYDFLKHDINLPTIPAKIIKKIIRNRKIRSVIHL